MKDMRIKDYQEAVRPKPAGWRIGVAYLHGNLGSEKLGLEVAQELREDYNFKIATIFLFEDQEKNWNEKSG